MKIHSVKFSNLNSLREEVDIDFVDGPLGAAGLFAITGPTGSGKSTILDAISLALYNSTARDQRHEIISRGSRKAESTVEFELKGKIYRSTWSMRLSKPRTEGKSPTGTASMELAVVSSASGKEDEIIGDMLRGERSVPALIEEMTGLNFSRFTQSMLLAQGQFDAFLVAPTKDRSDLLEQITGTQIYSDVSKLIYNRHKELSVALNARKEELEKRGVPDEEQIGKLTEEEATLAKVVEEQTKPLKLLREAHQAHQEYANVAAQLQVLTSEEKTFAEAATHREKVQATLAANLRAQPLVAGLKDLERIKAEAENLYKEQVNANELLPKLEQRKLDQSAKEAFAITRLQTAQEQLQKTNISIEKLKDLQLVLAKAQQSKLSFDKKLIEQAGQQEKFAKQKDEIIQETKELAARKASLDEILNSLAIYDGLEHQLPRLRETQQQFLQERESEKQLQRSWQESVSAKKVIEDSLLRLKEDAPATIDEKWNGSGTADEIVEQLSNTIEARQKYANWLGDFGGRLKNYLEDLTIFQKRKATFSQQQKLFGEAQKALSVLRREKSERDAHLAEIVIAEKLAKEAFEAIKLTAELRETHLHRLVDGEPCPLCGALEHPALKELPDVKPASHEDLWQSTKKNLEKQQQEAEALNRKVNEHELRVAELTDANTATEIQEQQKRFDARAKNLKTEYSEKEPTKDLKLEQATLDALRVAWKETDEEQKELTKERSEVQVLAKAWATYQQEQKTLEARLADQVERVDALADQLKRAQEKRIVSENLFKTSLTETELTLPDPIPDTYVDTLQAKVDELKRSQAKLEVILTKKEAGAKELKQLEVQIEALLKATAETQKEAATQASELSEKLEVQKKLLAGFESEDLLLKSAKEVLAKAEKEHTEITNELQATTKEVEKIELQQVERKKRLDALANDRAKLTKTLEAEIAKRKFESIEQAIASLLSEEEQQTLQSEMDAAARVQASLETRRNTLAASAKSLLLKLEKQPEAAMVATQLQQVEATLAKQQEALGGVRKELSRALEDRKAMERDAAEVAKRADELADWSTLNKLIGSATGSSFREYAQRVTLKQLIAYANEYLKEFYPRFSVSSDDARNNDPLEIFICDHYEADHVRKVATVSGGERFLVSMALALGFSRMASRNISIDTLFIDEGFGTLDGETLDKAIQALEKLQQRGKTIGIISHVASLQERIGAQIRLVRQSSGRSRVEVIG